MKKGLHGKFSLVVGTTCRWGCNVMMDFKEMRNEDVEWMFYSGYGLTASSCKHSNKLQGSLKVGEFSSLYRWPLSTHTKKKKACPMQCSKKYINVNKLNHISI